MIEADLYGKYEELQVVGGGKVHELTLQGWKLIAIMGDECTEPAYIEHVQFVPSHEDQYGSQKPEEWKSITAQRDTVVRTLLFLMGLDRDVATERLREKVRELKLQSIESDVKFKELEKDMSKDRHELGRLGSSNGHLAETNSNLHTELDAKSEVLNRMEEDMAKIRKAVGELEFNKILQGLNEKG